MAITGKNLFFLIDSCKESLEVFQCASCFTDETQKHADFGKALAYCFNLQVLDMAGCSAIQDDFFNNLASAEVVIDDVKTKPGLAYLHTVKLNFCKLITDMSLKKVLEISPELENLELTACENLSEYQLEQMFKNFEKLQFVDLNLIPVMTPAFYEVLKGHRPNILMRRYKI
jgi:hypothetical protein